MDTRDTLKNIYSFPDGTVDANNKISKVIDLSIIIPAYNVEQYIEQCVESILNQTTQYEFEVIIVNDGSKDKTAALLKRFEDDIRVKIIHQENRGFSGARNRALEEYHGKYIMFVDSDDYILLNAIENLLGTAYDNDADIVEGAAFSFYDDGKISRLFKHSCSNKKVNPVHDMTGYPGGKVFKSEIFEHIKFPEHFLFEDTILIMLIYPTYKDCWVINDEVYAYRVNMKGITQNLKNNFRSIESQWITLGQGH